ncbi:hypothetical protein APT65_00016 [Trabzonvirus APT65]|uniref:Uncharacterized protein n=1 Tax=Aeromonas phage APT65 TaxID=2982914 RepID=A0A9E8K1W9_9CAUD|nr:hypothetical protein APT65_00016 [Aeromonas phage APT65]
MSEYLNSLIGAILIALLSAASVGGFTVYKDVELLKSRTELIEQSIKEKDQSTERFTAMMNQMDRTLAVQAEAVNALKDAVKRLEQATYFKESRNDS